MAQWSKEDKEHNSKLPGMGGVFRPINLTGYQYAGLNPLRFIDPDGLADIQYFNKRTDSFFYKAQKKINFKKIFTVAGHGNVGLFVDKNRKRVSPKKLARVIKKHKRYKKGMVVRLISCNTGSGGDESYAQQLANELGTPVEGPDEMFWLGSDGSFDIASYKYKFFIINTKKPDLNKRGRFVRYKPKKGK